MNDVFIEMLHSWQTFYFTMGGAAAALLGLMFVALSLGTNLVSEATEESIQTFVTPSVVYFVSAFLLACVMLVPTYSPTGFAVTLFFGGILGMVITIPYVRKLFRAARLHQDFTPSDWLFQIMLPVLGYTLIVVASVGFVMEQWPVAFLLLWVAIILLLLCAIANTWSLVMWIVGQRVPPSED